MHASAPCKQAHALKTMHQPHACKPMRVPITAPESLIPNRAFAAICRSFASELLVPNLELTVGVLQAGSTACQRLEPWSLRGAGEGGPVSRTIGRP